MLRQVLQPVVRHVRAGARSYHVPSELKPAHMNELPVPSGSWQEHFNKKQRSQNMLLIGGILSVVVTVAFGLSTELLYFNAIPPSLKKE